MSRLPFPRPCVMTLAGSLFLLPMLACSEKHESERSAHHEAMESEERTEAEHDESATERTSEREEDEESRESPAPAQASSPSSPGFSKAPSAVTTPPAATARPAATTPASPSGTQAASPPPTPQSVTEPTPSPSSGAVVAVPATKPGLTRVGAEKCRLCHKVQYESWAVSAHATRKPPLDCESCHGPGSEYATLSVMKVLEKAQAAGLVIPAKSFCTESCHTKKWQDDMIKRVHAHKTKAVQG
jgi:hypothetical protein